MENITVILVHGAFADGSSWGDVIPLLEKAGYEAVSYTHLTLPTIYSV